MSSLDIALNVAISSWRSGDKAPLRDLFYRQDEFEKYARDKIVRHMVVAILHNNDAEELARILSENPGLLTINFSEFDDALVLRREVFEGAHRALRQVAIDQSRERPELIQSVAFSAMRVHDIGLAEQILGGGIGRVPSRPKSDSHFVRTFIAAEIALLKADYCKAERLYRSMLGRVSSVKALLGLAAVLVDRGRIEEARSYAVQALEKNGDVFAEGMGSLVRYFASGSLRGAYDRDGLVDVVVYCHPTRKMRLNEGLAPPNTSMLEGHMEWASRSAKLVASITIMYDHDGTDLGSAYLRNIMEVAGRYGADVRVHRNNGLRRQWIDGMCVGTARYVCPIEQDFNFLGTCPSLVDIVGILDRRADLFYVRLNQRVVAPVGFDYHAYQCMADVRDGITRTSMFTNSPHVMRRSFFEQCILPTISVSRQYDGENGGASGVEESIFFLVQSLEHLIGTPVLARIMGLGIWGNLGDGPSIRHVGY